MRNLKEFRQRELIDLIAMLFLEIDNGSTVDEIIENYGLNSKEINALIDNLIK